MQILIYSDKQIKNNIIYFKGAFMQGILNKNETNISFRDSENFVKNIMFFITAQ